MTSNAAKRRGRPIVVDGTRYYWKICMEFDQAVVYVLLPTGRRIRAPYYDVMESPKYDIAGPRGGLEITPSVVATFIRREIAT